MQPKNFHVHVFLQLIAFNNQDRYRILELPNLALVCHHFYAGSASAEYPMI